MIKIPQETKEWLLKSDIQYVHYMAQEILLPGKEDHSRLLGDPFIQENIQILQGWKEYVLQRHNKADMPLHRLAMLADLGIKHTDPGISNIIELILSDLDENGVPNLLIQIPPNFGGSGKPEKNWMLCDFPTILYSLLKMGVKNEQTDKMVNFLIKLVDENGYRCIGSDPKFRGPGSKTAICPYANLLSAKALGQDSVGLGSEGEKKAVEALLNHWELQKEKKYFLFGVGTDYKKLKFPFVWYNLLHVSEVVSHFTEFHQDKRFIEMVDLLASKGDSKLQFKPESIFMVYKKEEFSNKKEASRIITLLALSIQNRVGRISL